MQKFDLIVLGTGPGGEKAAVKAAYFGHSVAIIEKSANNFTVFIIKILITENTKYFILL